jgi:hypothetical protein
MLALSKSNSDRQEKGRLSRVMQAFADLASEGIMPGDSDGVRKFKSMMQGVDVQNVVKEKQDEADAMCEDINTRALKLRNRQLHHATEIYRKRNNLEKV